MKAHGLTLFKRRPEAKRAWEALARVKSSHHSQCLFSESGSACNYGQTFLCYVSFLFNILHSFGALSSAFPSTLEFVRFHTVLPFYRRERSDFEGGKGARKAARRRRGKKSASAPARNFRVVHYYLKQARSPLRPPPFGESSKRRLRHL